MGGGHGQLSRAYGLGADNVLRVDLVTADGELITATPDRHAELFWAVRGGGGNFGVVTSLEIRLHPVEEVYAGQALFPIERAADLLARYRDYAPAMPRELTCSVAMVGEHVAIRATYAGDASSGQRALRPLWSVAGAPVENTFAGVAVAQAGVPTTAPRTFELFTEVSDSVIENALAVEAGSIEFRYWGGAIADGTSPAGHRDVPFNIIVDGPAEQLWPYATGGSFLNALHDPDAVETAYTAADYQRLREVKAVWDPANVFHRNMNIKPA
jgi:FAD/FMN-containing dehydrogenase